MPDGWEAHLSFVEANSRPPLRACALMTLTPPDNLRDIRMDQVAIDAEGDYDEWDHTRPAAWQEEVRDGITIQWREPLEDWQPARVRLDRDGTRILIDSTALPRPRPGRPRGQPGRTAHRPP